MTTYTLTIPCSCVVFVVLDVETGLARSRVIEAHGPRCRIERHEAGARLYLWEMLPAPGPVILPAPHPIDGLFADFPDTAVSARHLLTFAGRPCTRR